MIDLNTGKLTKAAALAVALSVMPAPGSGEAFGEEHPQEHNPHHYFQEDIAAYFQNVGNPTSDAGRTLQNYLMKMRGGGKQVGFAGPDGWDISLHSRFTDFEDDRILAEGDMTSFELDLSTDLGDGRWGFGISRGDYEIGDGIDIESESWGVHLHASTPITDFWTIGALGMFNGYDDDVNDNGYAGTGALISSFHTELGDFDFGLTPSVVASNSDEGDESAFMCMLDVYWPVSDTIGLWVYGIYTDALSRGLAPDPLLDDGSYWNLGVEVTWQINDTVTISAGYDTTQDSEDYDDDTGKIGVVFSF